MQGEWWENVYLGGGISAHLQLQTLIVWYNVSLKKKQKTVIQIRIIVWKIKFFSLILNFKWGAYV